ncbi:MAG: LacI family DNA-binding transcriptional regulator [Chloroflexi bacterium]|nr:LacI family DNA-binding transcriptional regulator [Chloroflexota bacterium]
MPSIRDVAEEAGVSVATVSLVLNEKGSISPETRQRVLEVVDRLGYIRSRARSLRDNQSRVIGYAWDKQRSEFNPVLDSFLYAILRNAEAHGRNVLVFSAEDSTDVAIYRELAAAKRVDGFVLSHTVQDDPRFVYLHEAGVPFVAFGRSNTPLDDEVFWVDVDGQAGRTPPPSISSSTDTSRSDLSGGRPARCPVTAAGWDTCVRCVSAGTRRLRNTTSGS